MGVISMILLGIFVTVLTVILVVLSIAIPISIALLVVGGSTFAPSLAFSLLFTMGKSEHLIVSIAIFAVCFYIIRKMIQYRKVKNAIIVHLAVVASAISAFAVKAGFSVLVKNIPAWILLAIMIAVMIFTISPILADDDKEEKRGYPIITRATASVLYGSAINTLLGSLAVIFRINLPDSFVVASYFLWAFTSAIAYFLDIKLSQNKEFIKAIKEMPIRKLLKKIYDKFSNYVPQICRR